LLIFLLLSLSAVSQSSNSVNPNTKAKIDSTYEALIKKYKITGASIAVVDSGRIVYSAGYGFADRDNNIKADDKTVYRIGSITKSFTMISVMQLHTSGKLNYLAQISDYITEFGIKDRFNSTEMPKIADMMSHTSGLPSDLWNGFFANIPPEQELTIQQLKNVYRIAPAGYATAYSNVGYGLLGEVIERTSGNTYEHYLTENIFKPLEMTSSYVNFDSLKNHTFSAGYIKGKAVSEPKIRDAAAGLIHSNSTDMAHYLLMLLNNGSYHGKQIVSEKLLSEAEKNQLENLQLYNGMEYGYALMSNNIIVGNADTSLRADTQKYIGHGGDTFAFHADFGYIPELGVGAVILTNTDNGALITKCADLLAIYLKSEKQLTLRADPTSNFNKNEIPCPTAEISGNYESQFGLISVKNPETVKFKQSIAKIVLKKNPLNDVYDAKVYIFGFIPIKIRNQQFSFVKIGDEIFLKVKLLNLGFSEYIAAKSTTNIVSEAWQKRVGTYHATGMLFDVPKDFPFDTKSLKVKISMKDNFLIVRFRGINRNLQTDVVLTPLDDQNAVSKGFGRNTGTSITVLPNGNLFIGGFEIVKK